jgi:hypothetical protein
VQQRATVLKFYPADHIRVKATEQVEATQSNVRGKIKYGRNKTVVISEGRQILVIIKFSRATSRVKWLNGEKTNVSRTISVTPSRPVLQYPEDEDGDGSRNVGFFRHLTT